VQSAIGRTKAWLTKKLYYVVTGGQGVETTWTRTGAADCAAREGCVVRAALTQTAMRSQKVGWQAAAARAAARDLAAASADGAAAGASACWRGRAARGAARRCGKPTRAEFFKRVV
jgi:fermentation-respiration switch protein FrsA (DUF1100 family)